MQFFQFDSEGNMFMFAPGAGCTGVPRLVQPGEELIFSGESVESDWNNGISSDNVTESLETQVHSSHEQGVSGARTFNEPLKQKD